ncbi:MAG: phosphoribosylformylglycinamidine synthase subunit PurQ [Bacteriovoracaceae bacterium]
MRKVLVLCGDGINSERELGRAFADHGADIKYVHVNELLKNPSLLSDFQLLALPGGFSFGDELRSGKILAEKLRDAMSESLTKFLMADGRVIGICNGFQVLAQLGAFDWETKERSFTLAENNHGRFMDKWVRLTISSKARTLSPWFKDMDGSLFLPVRHKEGQIVPNTKNIKLPFAPLQYEEDINGSHERFAGVVNATGQVFGLMPHPEVATRGFLHPFREGAEENAQKVQMIFKNGLK